MATLSRETVLSALRRVPNAHAAGSGGDIVSSGVVSGVVVRGGQVGFALNVPAPQAAAYEPLRAACERAVASLEGVEKVTAVLTAETTGDAAPSASPTTRNSEKPALWNREPVPGVAHLIAIASGKGGVGKSTLTVCLAYALQALGLRVGILDADIYGPSMPVMLGLSGQPEVRDGKMIPLQKEGISALSIGFLMGDQAAVMRAPMVTKALNQMLRSTAWGQAPDVFLTGAPLDVLLIDMPPGTGDIHLSMAQQAPLSGAVVVTTPQQVAVADARKGVEMFRKLGVPVLGVVENMSYLEAEGAVLHPFGQGGGQQLAKEMATMFLGAVPLLPALGAALDNGHAPCLPAIFAEIAHTLHQQLSLSPRLAL